MIVVSIFDLFFVAYSALTPSSAAATSPVFAATSEYLPLSRKAFLKQVEQLIKPSITATFFAVLITDLQVKQRKQDLW
eukprot:UN03658